LLRGDNTASDVDGKRKRRRSPSYLSDTTGCDEEIQATRIKKTKLTPRLNHKSDPFPNFDSPGASQSSIFQYAEGKAL